MEDPFGGMFKLTGSNYSIWKSKMRDMLVGKDLWLPMLFGDGRPDQDRCTDLGGDVFEDNNIHPMLHRHELLQ